MTDQSRSNAGITSNPAIWHSWRTGRNSWQRWGLRESFSAQRRRSNPTDGIACMLAAWTLAKRGTRLSCNPMVAAGVRLVQERRRRPWGRSQQPWSWLQVTSPKAKTTLSDEGGTWGRQGCAGCGLARLPFAHAVRRFALRLSIRASFRLKGARVEPLLRDNSPGSGRLPSRGRQYLPDPVRPSLARSARNGQSDRYRGPASRLV